MKTKDIFLQLLIALQNQGIEIYFDRSENQFIKKDGDVYKSLLSTESTILKIDQSLLIPLSKIKSNTFTLDDYFKSIATHFNRTLTAKQPQNDRNLTAQQPQNNCNITAVEPPIYRKSINGIPYIFEHLPQSNCNEIADLTAKIEKTTIQILKNTNQVKTVKELKKRFEKVSKDIQSENLTALYETANRLENTLKRQKGAKETIKTVERKAARKKRLILAFVVFVLFSGFLTYYNFFRSPLPENNKIENFGYYVALYENTKNFKSEWRKNYIIQQLENCSFSSETEIINKIDSINNLKKF